MSTTPRSSGASCSSCPSGPRLRSHGLVARTVSIKIRFADFTTITRAKTLRDATDVGREVYVAARSLYDALGLQRARLRLVGVRLEGLVEADRATRQLALDERPVGWREADRAVDLASARFGAGAVRPASLVPDKHEERVREPGPAPS
jgi:DNA polymerase-4